MRYLTVTPAYGRDYRSKKEVQAAWDSGLDFVVQDFQQHGYINKDDVLENGTVVMVRYARCQKVMEVVR